MERAHLPAFYLSSVNTRDFVLVGAAQGGEAQLTADVPPGVRGALQRRFRVRDVDAINPDHPVVGQFQSWVQGE